MKATTRFGRGGSRAGRYLGLVAASVLMGSLSLATVGALSVAEPHASASTPPPTWEQLSPATSPPARYSASMAYDSGTGQLVLFGGTNNYSGNGPLNDTWIWNGTMWTQLSPATSPPALYAASMAYAVTQVQKVPMARDFVILSHAVAPADALTRAASALTTKVRAPGERVSPVASSGSSDRPDDQVTRRLGWRRTAAAPSSRARRIVIGRLKGARWCAAMRRGLGLAPAALGFARIMARCLRSRARISGSVVLALRQRM